MTLLSHPESQYLELLDHIIQHGQIRNDRTGTGTVSVFAPPQLRFSLHKFPLLTTKKMQLRPIFEELMWFVRGSTDAKILAAKKVNIWNANGSREFLDSRGLTHYETGDLGPVYGFQWRHFGAKYIDCHHDYTGQGVDQLRNVIKSILFNPMDRRIIISAWNPLAIPDMALPPCHMFCQFYVSMENETRTLSCQLYQRSCDMGLGVPFNIASYALLTYLIAHVCGYQVGEFIHCMGDTHIYSDHIEPLKEQIGRTPFEFPTLNLKTSFIEQGEMDNEEYVNVLLKQLESVEFTDLELVDYVSHGKVAMKMSV